MHTCVPAANGITSDNSTTTVFFRFLDFDGSAGGGLGVSADSVAASAGGSVDSAYVESAWAAPAFFLFFFFFVAEIVGWIGSVTALVLVASRIESPEADPFSSRGSEGVVATVELFTADVDRSGPTFRRFLRFWVAESVASGSVVI